MSSESQNGYIANDRTLTQVWTIPGTTRRIRLRIGAPGWLLVHLAAWFDKHVEDIEAGQLDDWGYAERPIRGGVELSNHASGTAIDLNSVKHPLGVRGTFTAAQAAAIRRQLLVYAGCIRWGGDYTNRPDEMHFEIVRDPAACQAVMTKLIQQEGTTVALTSTEIQQIADAVWAKTLGPSSANDCAQKARVAAEKWADDGTLTTKLNNIGSDVQIQGDSIVEMRAVVDAIKAKVDTL